jgi:hypothetical protein
MAYKKHTSAQVDEFISTVLKLGTKKNLFDTYMATKNIDPNELPTFMSDVIDKINKRWLYK